MHCHNFYLPKLICMRPLLLRMQLFVVATLITSFSFSQTFIGSTYNVWPGNNSCDAIQLEVFDQMAPAGISFPVPAGLTVSGLTTLSTDFQITNGYIDGAYLPPRFVAKVQTSCG